MKPFALMLLTATLLLGACASEKLEVQKSPCVGLDSSPCGPKRIPAGNWVNQDTIEQA